MKVLKTALQLLAISLLVIFSGPATASSFSQALQITFTLSAPGAALENPNTLLVAIRLNNKSDKTSFKVQLESIRLDSATLDSPTLLAPTTFPAAVGEIDAGQSAIVEAKFSSGHFSPRQQYSLVMHGSYQLKGRGADEDEDKGNKFRVNSVIVLPPASPGSARVKKVTVGANKVSGAPFPPRPPRFDDEVNGPGWTVPTGTFVPGKPTATSTVAQKAPIRTNLRSDSVEGRAAPIVFVANNALGVNSSTTAEPSGGTGGGVIFVSANWLAAYSSGGSTFTQLNPTTIFPADVVGFCCDQIVQYVPSINRFIWLLQGNGVRIASASPADIISSGGTAWTYWNLNPEVFGQPTGTGFDYPDLSVGDNYLYMSWDAGLGCPDGCHRGFQVARTSLAGIQAGGTITIDSTDPSDSPSMITWGSHLMQNTGDEIFWAGHEDNHTMVVYSMAEVRRCPNPTDDYCWRKIEISGWATEGLTVTTPDSQIWNLGFFPGNSVIGATRVFNQLWFAWRAGTDKNFQQPHVEMVTLDRNNNFKVIQQVQIWNNSYAFGYPALATNACTGEVGLSLEYGGNGNFENHVVGFWGDFVVYITTNSNVGTDRYGDYVTIRQEPPTDANPGNLFSAFGYGLNTGVQTDIRHIVFGREGCLKR